MIESVIEKWHNFLREGSGDLLNELLDDDVVFYSPIVYTPQVGKAVTALYLRAAGQTFPGDEKAGDGGTSTQRSFEYTKQVLAGDTAVLEFESTMQGKYVNGVDIIRCNDKGKIVEFRVMIRPLQAVQMVHQQMGAALERLGPLS